MKMLAPSRKGHTWCKYGCCRSGEFYGYRNRKLGAVRGRQRATERDQFRRELRRELCQFE